MRKIEKTDNKIVFASSMSDTIANSIRRYFNQVLVLAVDEIEMSRNDSPLYDEAVAHRVSLVPLKTEKSTNEKTVGKMKLSAEGEKIVHSGEMKGDFEVVFKNTPITNLAEGQELQLVAFVKAGKGSEHAKFSPGLMFYREVNEVIMDKDLYEEVKKTFPEADIKERAGKIILVDDGKREMLDFCEGLSEKRGKKIEITKKDEVVVTVESFGQMDADEIFKKSIEALKKDLAHVQKSVDKA